MATAQVSFQENIALFGKDLTDSIVAVEYDGRNKVELFLRKEGKIERGEDAFRPFLFLSDLGLLDGWKGEYMHEKLSGEEEYRYLVYVESWSALQSLMKFLQKKTGSSPGSFDAPFYFLNDPVHQYLLLSGKTLFKGMVFEDLSRLQLDIETYCQEGFEFSNPARDKDRVIFIALSDGRGWERLLSAKEMHEKEMLEELVREIKARDPDVIEGHNIFKFDLPYIEARAKRHGVFLSFGRDSSQLLGHSSRLQIAERTIIYPKYEAFGRHFVDTWLLAQFYDVSARTLESYGLKDVARHFGVAREDRTYVEPDLISWYFDHDPETLARYALDDVREVDATSAILSPIYFIQSQIFPYSYQDVIVRGNATKIDALLLREYIRQRASVPKPSPAQRFEGGYTGIFLQGLVENVIHVDVQSLYPSIMLTFKCFPARDGLGIFSSLLQNLKDFRIAAKNLARQAEDRRERQHLEALQATFKVLINSFYGYLGFQYGHFSDFEQAAAVTAKGRELVQKMLDWLRENGCQPVEIDTDGIYFVPPAQASTPEWHQELVERLSSILPKGITLELAGDYPAMFSYKMKNYALLRKDGGMLLRGSGLRSRGLELFQRKFLEEMLFLLLSGKQEKIPVLLEKYREDILNHRWDRRDFQKTETLQESPSVYAEKVKGKKRAASAVYELALRSGRAYQAGDQISYYVTGRGKNVRVFENAKLANLWDPENPDENTEYYLKKLQDLYDKFEPLFNNWNSLSSQKV